MKRLYTISTILVSLFLLTSRCSNPATPNKETLVRKLITAPFNPGEYSIFWNGKDDDKNYVSPGKYYCDLYETTTGDTIHMTVLEGGEIPEYQSEIPEYIGPRSASVVLLFDNSPDPFHVKQGTYIHFNIAYATSIRLTIHSLEE